MPVKNRALSTLFMVALSRSWPAYAEDGLPSERPCPVPPLDAGPDSATENDRQAFGPRPRHKVFCRNDLPDALESNTWEPRARGIWNASTGMRRVSCPLSTWLACTAGLASLRGRPHIDNASWGGIFHSRRRFRLDRSSFQSGCSGSTIILLTHIHMQRVTFYSRQCLVERSDSLLPAYPTGPTRVQGCR